MFLFIANSSNNSGGDMCIGLDKKYLSVHIYLLVFIDFNVLISFKKIKHFEGSLF